MKMLIIIVAVFTVLYFAVRHQELSKGRESYKLKDFLLELINHKGDINNYKR